MLHPVNSKKASQLCKGDDETKREFVLTLHRKVIACQLNAPRQRTEENREIIMANSVGGELAGLASLRQELVTRAQDVETLKQSIDGKLSSTVWTGVNADNFRQSWESFKTTLGNLQQSLSQAAEDIRKQHNNLAAATGDSATI